jgi:hypothetical protein
MPSIVEAVPVTLKPGFTVFGVLHSRLDLALADFSHVLSSCDT